MSVNKIVIQKRQFGRTAAFCKDLSREIEKGERVFVAVSDEKDFRRVQWGLKQYNCEIEYEPIITPAHTKYIFADETDLLWSVRCPSFRIIPEQLHGYMVWKKK